MHSAQSLASQKAQQSIDTVNAVSTGSFRKFDNPRSCLLGIKMINHLSDQQRRIQFAGSVFCQLRTQTVSSFRTGSGGVFCMVKPLASAKKALVAS